MRTYEISVEVTETYTGSIFVEAQNMDEALELATDEVIELGGIHEVVDAWIADVELTDEAGDREREEALEKEEQLLAEEPEPELV